MQRKDLNQMDKWIVLIGVLSVLALILEKCNG